jgi:hypothetical protein
VYPNYYNTASIPVIAVEAFSNLHVTRKHLFEGERHINSGPLGFIEK